MKKIDTSKMMRDSGMDEHTIQAKELLDVPLSLFGGADGGVGFVYMRSNLIECIRRAEEGDVTAQMLVKEFKRATRLYATFSQPINFG